MFPSSRADSVGPILEASIQIPAQHINQINRLDLGLGRSGGHPTMNIADFLELLDRLSPELVT